MNPPLPSANVNSDTPLSPQSAWSLWRSLNQLADELWRSYEKEFLDFCIEEDDSVDPDRPLPFD
jgi:hypothetical protein